MGIAIKMCTYYSQQEIVSNAKSNIEIDGIFLFNTKNNINIENSYVNNIKRTKLIMIYISIKVMRPKNIIIFHLMELLQKEKENYIIRKL